MFFVKCILKTLSSPILTKRTEVRPLNAVPTVFDIPNPPPKFANRRPAPRERIMIATGEENSPAPMLFPSPSSVSTEDPPSPVSPTSTHEMRVLKLKKKVDSQRKRIKRLRPSPSVACKQKEELATIKSLSAKYLRADVYDFFALSLTCLPRRRKDGMHKTKASHFPSTMSHPRLIFFFGRCSTCRPSLQWEERWQTWTCTKLLYFNLEKLKIEICTLLV